MNFKCLHSFAQEHLHGPTGLGSTRQKRSGFECRKLLIFFGAEKRYTRARVLAPSLKNGGNFVDRINKRKLRTLSAFPIFLESNNILTSLMESWKEWNGMKECFRGQ